MIKKVFFRNRADGVNLFRTYSDANLMIQKIGTEEIYSEAIDIEGAPYEYIETKFIISDYSQYDDPDSTKTI